MLDKPIRVWVDPNRSVFLVWNTEDVQRLRKHRIVGELVGTLVGHKSQNDYLGLPLQLSTEEVSIGCIYGFLELVTWKESVFDSPVEKEETTRVGKKRSYSEMESSDSSLKDNEGALQKIPRTITSFCRTALSNFFSSFISMWKSWNDGRESLQQKYLEPVIIPNNHSDTYSGVTEPTGSNNNTKTTIWIEEPQDKDSVIVLYCKGMPIPDFLPSFGVESLKSRRLNVFHDLWKRGFYISSGIKFGADFLAYADDPILFHASLAVIVVDQDSVISPRDLVAFGRLGVSTKKKATLAYVKRTSNKNERDDCMYSVVYLCIRWNESLP